MLVELPTLASRVRNTAPWAFRWLPLEGEDVLQGPLHTIEMRFECSYDSWQSTNGLQLSLSLRAGDDTSLFSATFHPRGRWRPHYPMGGIEFYRDGRRHRYNLILQQPDATDHGELGKLTDLTMAELFAGECWTYSVLFSITNICLRSRRLRVSLCFDDIGPVETNGLLIEDIGFAQAARGGQPDSLTVGPIEAVDILNLNLLQAIVGNADYFFDYDDNSRFVAHNVAAFELQGSLVPFPYDLQFSVVLTPFYQRHRQFSIDQEARINARRISAMLRKLPPLTDLAYVECAVSEGANHLIAAGLSATVHSRYEHYLHTLSEELKSSQ